MSEVGDAAIELAAALVGIDSVNPSLVPGATGETAIVAFLERRLAASGWRTVRVESLDREGRPSLLAIPPRVSGPVVILNGHLDTVGVEGMPHPFTPRIDHDRLVGRGAADMKGGVAALVVAAEHLMASGAAVTPVLALVADEEDASRGSEAVIAALDSLDIRPELCVIAEPTDLALARSLRGFAVVEVTFTGRAAHSSQRSEGIDAIEPLTRFLSAVADAAPGIRETGGELMVTTVRAGSSPFVVADRAQCVVERRTVPGEIAAVAVDEIRALVPADAEATVVLVAHREAWRLDRDGAAPDFARRLGSALGTRVDFDAPYWMEAPLWQQECPTVICGPSGGGLHAVDEWLDLTQLTRYTDALVSTLDRG